MEKILKQGGKGGGSIECDHDKCYFHVVTSFETSLAERSLT